jgi:hypothetical protein
MAQTALRILPIVQAEVLLAAGGHGNFIVCTLLRKFFLDPSPDQMRMVASKLVIIHNGLSLTNQTLMIKSIPSSITKNAENEVTDAYGFVVMDDLKREASPVNMDRSLFDGNQNDHALTNYIHEASHKYAFTEDWDGGQWNNEGEVAGYRNNKMTSFYAVDNADTYGHFCVSLMEALNI